jgi:hypothetical protein
VLSNRHAVFREEFVVKGYTCTPSVNNSQKNGPFSFDHVEYAIALDGALGLAF